MPFPRAALACLVFAAPIVATSADKASGSLEISIDGLSSELEEAVRSGLTLQQYRDRTVSDAQLRRLLEVGEGEIRATLEAWGYYQGSATSRMEETPESGFHVWFDVTPGQPTLVTESHVTVSGAVEIR